MTQYEKMARRVVEDGLIAMADKCFDYEGATYVVHPEKTVEFVQGYADAILLGLKELLKEDKIHVYDPDKLLSNLG